MNINLVTNTHYVILWAITSIESMYERILNANILQEYYLKVIKMSLN